MVANIGIIDEICIQHLPQMNILETLYKREFGVLPDTIEKLAAAGSSREYYRLTSSKAVVIGTIGNEAAENIAFIYLSKHFFEKGLPVPRVLCHSADMMAYLQEDLGEKSLYDVLLKDGLDGENSMALVEKTLTVLAKVHSLDCEEIDGKKLYPRKAMDNRSIMWDLNYFKYCFLKPSVVSVDEDKLQDEFERLAGYLISSPVQSMILRDFQSRNIMVCGDSPYLIDFQGARFGPALYDLSSFLWQARLGMPEEMKWHFAEKYVTLAKSYGLDFGDNWRNDITIVALFRMLQVLGAYGFRGLIEHRSQFVTPIPAAVESAVKLLDSCKDTDFSCLSGLLRSILHMDKYLSSPDDGMLKVKVISFSYKKGIPEDYTGNGGGFVFDCRAMLNPGRFKEYKKLTGRDRAVSEFLEKQGEIQPFLSACYSLVDKAVENYISRGFSNLVVCFGCTGGQHRSLYSAEHMARHIAKNFNCHVQLIHREQNINETLK